MKKLLTTEELINEGFEGLELQIAESAMRNNLDAEVFDPHFKTTIKTDISLAYNNGRYFFVGFDSTNQIVEIELKESGMVFDNTCIIGSYKGNRKISGWAFDREDAFIYGFESDEYYKEASKAS